MLTRSSHLNVQEEASEGFFLPGLLFPQLGLYTVVGVSTGFKIASLSLGADSVNGRNFSPFICTLLWQPSHSIVAQNK